MNQNYFIILLPTIFLIGTYMVYRSYKSVNSISNRDKDKLYNPPELNNLVNVEFFVMSQCPDAAKCERLFLPSLLKLSPISNFTLSFIGSEPSLNDFQCKHGSDECMGNKQQLCVQNMYSTAIFINYLLCQSKQVIDIPNNGEKCAKENNINWSQVQSCITSNKSNKLFRRSLKRTRLAGATRSCTMHINGKFWCMHDGGWINCKEGTNEKNFIQAICSRYNGKNKPNECTSFI